MIVTRAGSCKGAIPPEIVASFTQFSSLDAFAQFSDHSRRGHNRFCAKFLGLCMSLLYNVLFAWKCSSTHHKLALDALRHLRGRGAPLWHDLFLSRVDDYLKGAKAPDNDFKDFRNHVLHVRENYWGGALAAAEQWYDHTVEALAARRWMQAAYAAGVLSHYFTDPFQPFHTAQSEAEGAVHRAAEWSIAKSYEALQKLLDEQLGGYPQVEVPNQTDWLAAMIRRGADHANPHYEFLIDHYDLRRGVKDPPAGLDDESRRRLAFLIGQAAVGFARVLERAIADSQSPPPRVDLTLQTVFESLNVPVQYVTKKLQDGSERRLVERMYAEFCANGKVVKTLPADDQLIRRLHAEEVLHVPLAQLDAEQPRLPGTLHGAQALDGWKPVAAPQKAKTTMPTPVVSKSTTAPTTPPKNPPSPRSVPAIKVPAFDLLQPVTPPREPTKPQPSVIAKPAPAVVRLPEPEIVEVTPLPPIVRRPQPAAPPPTIVMAPAIKPIAAIPPPPAAITKPKPNDFPEPRPEPTPSLKVNAPPPEKPRPSVAPAASQNEPLRYYLEATSPIVDGPSIGQKTARRLSEIGVKLVGDLLTVNPESAAAKLNVKHITADVIRQWQDEAALVCQVPNLRGHDAQILVACGLRAPAELAAANAPDLLELAFEYANSQEGSRIVRGSTRPDLAEVRDWISWASSARGTRAA